MGYEERQKEKQYEERMKIVNFVRGMISLEGNVNMTDTGQEWNGDHTIYGYIYNENDEAQARTYSISKSDLEEMQQLKTIEEMIEYYFGMGYFREV